MNNSKNTKKLKAMETRDERLEFMATANRVTIGEITQLVGGDLVTSFTARIRGMTFDNGEKFKFDTRDEARAFGWSLLLKWKAEWAKRREFLF